MYKILVRYSSGTWTTIRDRPMPRPLAVAFREELRRAGLDMRIRLKRVS